MTDELTLLIFLFFAVLVTLLSLWKKPDDERNTQGVMPSSGIKAIGSTDAGRTLTKAVHVDAVPSVDQQAQRAGRLVLAAAWWVVNVVSPPATAIHDPVLAVGKKLWPSHAWQVADFVQMRLVPFLLFEFLAWPIAEDYLRAKWKAEVAEQNRLDAARRGQP